jgi:glyoxylase-like metal-dependent hydrolase (beta-lactamase superfamily II)
MVPAPIVTEIFEPVTATWQYIVADPTTKDAVIIDSVLDFDPATRTLSSKTADNLLAVVAEKGYRVAYVLETHAHADHLTAAKYLQAKLAEKQGGFRPQVGIGKRIVGVQDRFAARYGVPKEELAGVFDKLFEDDEEFAIGELRAQALHLPGHTPDHVGYMIGGTKSSPFPNRHTRAFAG